MKCYIKKYGEELYVSGNLDGRLQWTDDKRKAWRFVTKARAEEIRYGSKDGVFSIIVHAGDESVPRYAPKTRKANRQAGS